MEKSACLEGPVIGFISVKKSIVYREQSMGLDWGKGGSEPIARNETEGDSIRRSPNILGDTYYVYVHVCV